MNIISVFTIKTECDYCRNKNTKKKEVKVSSLTYTKRYCKKWRRD